MRRTIRDGRVAFPDLRLAMAYLGRMDAPPDFPRNEGLVSLLDLGEAVVAALMRVEPWVGELDKLAGLPGVPQADRHDLNNAMRAVVGPRLRRLGYVIEKLDYPRRWRIEFQGRVGDSDEP